MNDFEGIENAIRILSLTVSMIGTAIVIALISVAIAIKLG